MPTIVIPKNATKVYTIATEEFQNLWQKCTNQTLEIITDKQALEEKQKDDLIVIGSDSVNDFTARYYLDLKIEDFGLKYESDDYAIRSYELDGKKILFLAGARGRSTLYAVYRYFELYGGCRYFWDGDKIPTYATIPLENINLFESPKHKYRGIRYFAHRSLHRFQAEHWSFEDWKKEIDWLLKKRLNIFMLRIGSDDIFQKAFPDIVPYPPNEGKLPEAMDGYNDRSLFWSLEFRGELRKKILVYAFERDLIHPEDCGTITHWYSRTPIAYLQAVKPKLLSQSGGSYNEETGRVWDIFDGDNFERYFKLTDTHIKEYGKAEIFHTIGFAERMYSEDREVNMRLKEYVYRKTQERLQKKYPGTPLLIASWDFWQRYEPDEVKHLVKNFNPENTIIFDYTSETRAQNNFENWGIIGKFPWIFGIFGAYEKDNDIRGNYPYIDKRLALAKSDSKCEGVVYWPELSHGDTFMTEYLAANAWSEKVVETEQMIKKFCADRYGDLADKMAEIWKLFMPVIAMKSWSGDEANGEMDSHIFFRILVYQQFDGSRENQYLELGNKNYKNAIKVLKLLSEILPYSQKDEFLRRDVYDILRAVVSRFVDQAIMKAEKLNNVENSKVALNDMLDKAYRLNELHTEVLAGHEDFSMYQTVEGLKKVAPVNPIFEETIKNNASSWYCRSSIYENAKYLYLPEMKILFDAVRSGKPLDKDAIQKAFDQSAEKNYYGISLKDMISHAMPLDSIIKETVEIITSMY